MILSYANQTNRLIPTLDGDFGTLVFKSKQPFIGIIRLHPGHLIGAIHVPPLQDVWNADIDYQPPFLLVTERRADQIHIRYQFYGDA